MNSWNFAWAWSISQQLLFYSEWLFSEVWLYEKSLNWYRIIGRILKCLSSISMSKHDLKSHFCLPSFIHEAFPGKCIQVCTYKHTSMHILFEILQKSFMGQLQSTVLLKYFVLFFNNHHILILYSHLHIYLSLTL